MPLTFSTIKTEVAAVLRLDVNKAAENTLVERWINDAIQDIHGRHDWNWTLDRAVVQTVVDKTAGTVAVSVGGTTVTGTSTVFAATDVGSFIQLKGSDDWYKILTVTPASSLTIESAYVGATALTVGTYTIRKNYYTLSNAEKILTIREATTPARIWPVHYRSFDEAMPFSDDTGTPTIYCVYGADSSGGLRFMLNPWPDAVMNLEIRYKKLAVESDVTGWPEPFRCVIVDGALSKGYEYVALGSAKEFDHQAIVLKRQMYEAGISKMINDAEPMQDWQPRLRNRDVRNGPFGPHLPYTLTIPQD